VVTPSPVSMLKGNSDKNIEEFELADENIVTSSGSNYIEHSSRKKLLPKQSSHRVPIHQTRSGKVFKPQKVNEKGLKRLYPGRSNKQLQVIRSSSQQDRLI